MKTEIKTDGISNFAVSNDYSNYTELGGRMVQRTPVENHHDLMVIEKELSAVDNDQFRKSLYAVQGDRTEFYSGDDKIKLSVSSQGKVKAKLKGVEISGVKRTAVYMLILETCHVLDTNANGDWNMYVFSLNGKFYNIGFLDENINANFMSKYNEFYDNINNEEYYKELFKQRTKHSTDKVATELHSDVYGDAVSGLGSIVEDQIEEDLLQALEMLRAYKDTPQFTDIKADLEEIVCSA